MVTQDQLTRFVDGALLTVLALTVGSFIGWLRYSMPPLICGARGHLRDLPPGTWLVCELRPFHEGAHRQGLRRWVNVRLPGGRPMPRRCLHGHLHPNMAGRDECERRARLLLRSLRVPPSMVLGVILWDVDEGARSYDFAVYPSGRLVRNQRRRRSNRA